jgi:hypothetical protein
VRSDWRSIVVVGSLSIAAVIAGGCGSGDSGSTQSTNATARGPKPWIQHRASTIFLRVPTAGWTAIRHGKKREFGAESGSA